MLALERNNIWHLVQPAFGNSVVRCRVYTEKVKQDESVICLKAISGAKVYSQTYSVDYSEIFYLVPKMNSARLLSLLLL